MSHVVRRGPFLIIASLVALLMTPALATAETPEEPWIEAQSAIVVDAMTGEVLYNHDADSIRAMASLTKLFTAFVALETTPLDRTMNVAALDLVGEASMGLEAGETMSFRTLLHGMLLPSGNDAASAIARNLGDGSPERFIQRANIRLQELGLTSTHIVNPHGLDAEGHHSSARDIAALTLYALHHEPQFVATLATQSYTGDGHTLYSTNRFFNAYPGFVGGKTGVTDDAGYCLMQIAERDGRVLVTVLLGSTSESWYSDAGALLDYGFTTLSVTGRVSGSDVLPTTFEPQTVSEPVPAALGLSVENSAEGAIVAAPALVANRSWSPWFWLGAVAVVVPSIIVILVQIQRLLALVAFGPQSRKWANHTPAAAHLGRAAVAPRASAWETRPFGTLGSPARPTPQSFESGMDMLAFESWNDMLERSPLSDDRKQQKPAPVPSFD